ncbi:major capsid protein [Chenggangzhangella methanolivorans]|uniref:Major capsid protein n=1 Tax=Chenggangzhangella methanolivorans TaxID=1437009 RepID=A0A9E6UM84_9HYPH|nr:major capsid protein [Chenggangzhangella methanolivorans]QZN99790.1 major capsid protein [Chenggangzhangella methanolivorans]
MALDIYTPAVLNRVVDDLKDDPLVGTHLVNRYFSEVSQSLQEEVYFDVLTEKPRLAPFCSPLVEGQIVRSQGYATKSFRPAYIKDKRVLEDGKAVRRRPGQAIAGPLDPMQTRLLQIAANSEDQIRMINRRLEWMASTVLRTGQVTISGEKYPTTVVDFGRDPSLTVTLSGGALWSDPGADPLEDLEDWSSLIRGVSGARAAEVHMADNVWRAFRKNEGVKELLQDNRYSPGSALELGAQSAKLGATYKGTIGDFQIWIYADSYVDDAGVTRKYLPDDYLLLVSPDLEGVRHFGVIKDEECGFQVRDYFQKSWTQPDPAVRYMLMQSAPIVVPYRINATLSAKVL